MIVLAVGLQLKVEPYLLHIQISILRQHKLRFIRSVISSQLAGKPYVYQPELLVRIKSILNNIRTGIKYEEWKSNSELVALQQNGKFLHCSFIKNGRGVLVLLAIINAVSIDANVMA